MTLDEAIKHVKNHAAAMNSEENFQIAKWLEELKLSRTRVEELTQELAYASGRAFAAEEAIGTLRSQAVIAIERMKDVLKDFCGEDEQSHSNPSCSVSFKTK